MKQSLLETVIGAFVLMIASAFAWFVYSSQSRTGRETYEIQAEFDRIDGLVNGNDVRLSGVKVGQVTNIRIDPQTYRAAIAMSVSKEVKIPEDSSAEILSESFMGGKYVNLAPGGSQTFLDAGSVIQDTQSSVSLEGLIAKFIFSGSSEKKD